MLRKNILKKELICKCGCDNFIISEPVLDIVQFLREHYNKPIIIHSAFRCEAHNNAIGGKSNSQHLLGRAIDFHIDGVDIEVIYNYLNTKYPNCLGLGKYKSFIHIDDRMIKAFRWSK